ncbi:MAG: HAD family hydrolase [SAR116 cluster bacterium]|nr:HAD family hydrolase [SAR116 cluster bacterium]
MNKRYEIELIGFDADDTLWENENIFHDAQKQISKVLENHNYNFNRELFNIEKKNLEYYGYGIKGFILSLIETSLKISNKKLDNQIIKEILDLGKKMLSKKVKVLPNIKTTLEALSKNYNLVLITKGDLLDQEKKIYSSELSKYFSYIEIVSHKNEKTYMKILEKYNIKPKNFLMIGNSLKSDVLPVTNIGGMSFYIPFELTWELEKVEVDQMSTNYVQLENISEILTRLKSLEI